ncbi:MAG: NAD(P)-dependent oxidoreductase [Acetobacterales bacterium]
MIDRLLITGAAGEIATALRHNLDDLAKAVRLSDLRAVENLGANEEYVAADLTRADEVARMVDGVDAIVHLGGIPRESTWDRILPANIVGLYNVFEAARVAGVSRIIFASSNHTIGFHPVTERVDAETPVRPDGIYAVSKVFGEALGRLYADKYAMSVACLRIGAFRRKPQIARHLTAWASPADIVRLVRACLTRDFHFITVYGVSANSRRMWFDDSEALLGFVPRDNAEAYASELPAPDDPDGIGHLFHGGDVCAGGFVGGADRMLGTPAESATGKSAAPRAGDGQEKEPPRD